VTLGPGGAIWALKPVLIVMINKNKGKRIAIKQHGDELTFEGYSAAAVDRFIGRIETAREERSRQVAALRDRRPEGADPE
jgi:hypothetical protein